MIYTVMYRIPQDARAPGAIKLSEYEEGPEVEVRSRGAAPLAISKLTDDPTSKNRAIRIGDVLRDEQDNFYIYTPSYQWALVQAID